MVDEKIPSFNFDIAEGVSYRLNLSKPNGSRIENREFKGSRWRQHKNFAWLVFLGISLTTRAPTGKSCFT